MFPAVFQVRGHSLASNSDVLFTTARAVRHLPVGHVGIDTECR